MHHQPPPNTAKLHPKRRPQLWKEPAHKSALMRVTTLKSRKTVGVPTLPMEIDDNWQPLTITPPRTNPYQPREVPTTRILTTTPRLPFQKAAKGRRRTPALRGRRKRNPSS
ncbi:hypothetical protein L484_010072 [Morus notabilis]|uniref:Uncharacterized protein n=1 Tax=Morus notabilis TaxID=981085 RepID=W9RET6_9ROSA|nr:hypothetical protein L484_010072 [Morus notabilis]